MKGFKKDGKFRPTEKQNQSSLKKSDVKHVTSHSGVGHEMREKKSMNNEIKVTSINFWTANNYDIPYHINDDGDVVYEGGIRTALETLGARKLSTKEVGALLDMDDDTDFTYSQFYGKDADQDDVAEDYAREKQDDHSQNFLPTTAEDYNFGLFKVQGRPFISITGDDDKDDGIYDLMFILDEEGLGEDHQSWYAGALINPELIIEFEYNGKKGQIRKSNERDGKYQEFELDGSDADEDTVLGEYAEDLDIAVEKFNGGKK